MTVSNGMDAPTFDGINVPEWKCQQPLEPEGAPTMQITTIGIDLAKNVFQIHGADQRGKAVLRKQLRRDQVAPFFANLPPRLIMTSRRTAAFEWARTETEDVVEGRFHDAAVDHHRDRLPFPRPNQVLQLVLDTLREL